MPSKSKLFFSNFQVNVDIACCYAFVAQISDFQSASNIYLLFVCDHQLCAVNILR